MKTTQARYEVGSEDVGVIDYESSLYDACRIARTYVINHPESTAYIYDRMAQVGGVELREVKREGVEIRMRAVRQRER